MKRFFVVVLTMMMFASFGYSQLGFKTVRAKVGMIMPEDPYDVGFDIGAATDLGEITKNLHLVPNIAYWSTSWTLDAGFLGTYDYSISNFQIGADVNYFFTPNAYAGGGLSFNFFGGDTGGSTEIGFDFLGGYIYPLKSFNLYAEARYNFISNFNTFEIVVGAEFPLKK